MALLDYDALTYDFQQVPALKLLKAEHAVLILSFLHQQFKYKQRVNVPLGELSERLEDYLETLNTQQEGRYPRTALAYLTEWADDEHRFLRIVNNEEPVVELTADTERAIGWVEELHAQPFVGTESRFLSIIQMLRDMVSRSTEDPELRLQQLEQQRDELERQIVMIYQTGEVDDRYTPTQIKERFFGICFQAWQLLRDFRLIEEKFREVARSIREAQLTPDAQKGSLIEYVGSLCSVWKLGNGLAGHFPTSTLKFCEAPKALRSQEKGFASRIRDAEEPSIRGKARSLVRQCGGATRNLKMGNDSLRHLDGPARDVYDRKKHRLHLLNRYHPDYTGLWQWLRLHVLSVWHL